MKITRGRGIQFFKQPFFSRRKNHAMRIYKFGQTHVVSAINRLGSRNR